VEQGKLKGKNEGADVSELREFDGSFVGAGDVVEMGHASPAAQRASAAKLWKNAVGAWGRDGAGAEVVRGC